MRQSIHGPARQTRERRGAILVKVAILMPVLIGMMGLTIDAGFLMSSKRQVQNAADAAAMAAAMDLMRGKSAESALATANRYVQTENGLSEAPPLVVGSTFNIGPKSGPHQGLTNYVEVIVQAPYQTLFMHVLLGERDHSVAARAVAGYEPITAGEGLMALDVNPPGGIGLETKGNAVLKVDGRLVVNAENPDKAAVPSKNGIYAKEINVVGGVVDPELFLPYDDGASSPLHLGMTPEPDPLQELPVPVIANGVDSTDRGEVKITAGSVSGVTTGGYVNGTNSQASEGVSVANGLHEAVIGEVVLHPGVYDSIDITGGTVYMIPGIYVIAGGGLSVTGGMVVGENIMIYNTGDNYEAASGTPDINDGGDRPPSGGPTDGATFEGVSLTSSINISPIDTDRITELVGGYHLLYNGAKSVSSTFDGMTYYQRRYNTSEISITGNAADGALTGSFYSKWGHLKMAGQGAFQAQFIVGSVTLSGNGTISVLGAGENAGRANNLFLVE